MERQQRLLIQVFEMKYHTVIHHQGYFDKIIILGDPLRSVAILSFISISEIVHDWELSYVNYKWYCPFG